MFKQINRFSVHQTSKVLALVYAIFVVFISIGLMITEIMHGGNISTLIGYLALPLMSWIFYYVFMAFFLLIYNFAAGLVGGIEFEPKDKE